MHGLLTMMNHERAANVALFERLVMEMGMLPCIVILLVSFAHVDARYKAEPVSLVKGDKLQYMDNLPPEYICDSCVKPAKRTEEISRELKLFEKLGMILTEVCHILPSEFKDKCLKTSDAYVHRTKLLVNGVSNEETICNITGLYLLKSIFVVINGLASVTDEEKGGSSSQLYQSVHSQASR